MISSSTTTTSFAAAGGRWPEAAAALFQHPALGATGTISLGLKWPMHTPWATLLPGGDWQFWYRDSATKPYSSFLQAGGGCTRSQCLLREGGFMIGRWGKGTEGLPSRGHSLGKGRHVWDRLQDKLECGRSTHLNFTSPFCLLKWARPVIPLYILASSPDQEQHLVYDRPQCSQTDGSRTAMFNPFHLMPYIN